MLTVVQIRALKPAERPYKVADSDGLYLLVQPSGALLWRFRYRCCGIERKLSLGSFPDVTLVQARRKRDEAKAELAAQTTFALVAGEYIEKMEREGRSPATIKKARWFLELLDGIAKRPIAAITPHELLDVLKRVERRGHHETALRLRSFAGRVFRYGFATLRTERNPADILRGALTVPRVKHHAAIVEPKKVGDLLRAIDGHTGRPETLHALRIAPHVFLRPGELRQAKWSEIDFAEKVWRVPAERMKMKQPHAVPLSRQVLFLLQDLRSLARDSEFLFPALHTTKRCISDNTLNVALRRLGFENDEMTSHGFRAMASTLLNESGLWHPDAIERALAHGEKDKVRAAYHRGAHWAERVRMAQWWSDYLDQLRIGGAVIKGKFRKRA
ncbi:tyrosine-type recombinase/integrase [Sphingomonas sanguinis]|jgi:integrase|uniref:Tyrosine-type recombinase/integrase n=1 Tax=Sphingomonas sanguinis TaxID=33051 RepID=A0A7Y7QWH3_9SPHN|nr:integrase arm-type DNA-binding domain-containing protein [Sphingomonas sanguinis]MBZ6382692.1 tyrosine-type recombinase/integrase [Sphingomonas sanguinis]NNG49767.1 tyrosine-type recombinase/integrase [Sphingomonas sanguinis]NNG54576.1 tyrosine-type recombinase/integrase [Sphingomonas sanguinis]NVP31990.1 tyrosine-type recombinase/integrase [Sphingomonas sanguinis]